jgi:hypothetical protein
MSPAGSKACQSVPLRRKRNKFKRRRKTRIGLTSQYWSYYTQEKPSFNTRPVRHGVAIRQKNKQIQNEKNGKEEEYAKSFKKMHLAR